jgi:hypothetical protein
MGGWDIQNLLESHSLAVLLIVLGALAFLGLLTIGFRGSVVV